MHGVNLVGLSAMNTSLGDSKTRAAEMLSGGWWARPVWECSELFGDKHPAVGT